MIELYQRGNFGVRWVWMHGNECRWGRYAPRLIEVLIRPVSSLIPAESAKPAPVTRLRILHRKRRFHLFMVIRHINMIRGNK